MADATLHGNSASPPITAVAPAVGQQPGSGRWLRRFRDWSLATKVLLAFVAILPFVALETVLALAAARQQSFDSEWVSHTYEVISSASEANAALANARTDYFNYIRTGAGSDLAQLKPDFDRYDNTTQNLVALTTDNPAQEKRWADVDVVEQQFRDAINRNMSRRATGPLLATDPATTADSQLILTKLDPMQQVIQDGVAEERQLLDQRAIVAERSTRLLLGGLLGGFVIVVFAVVILALYVSRRISQSLGRISTAARDLASGQLSTRTGLQQGDEIGTLGKNFDSMADTIQDLVGRLERQTATTTQLGEMGDLLRACQSPAEAFEVTERSFARLFPGQSGALYTLNSSETLLERVVAWGQPSPAESTFSPNDCWALRRSRPHPDSDVAVISCNHLRNDDISHPVCLPLLGQGRALGVLVVSNSSAHDPATSDRRLLLSAADQTALSMANLRLQERLRNQALRDGLTGLYNRRYLEETMERELTRATRNGTSVGVVMLDIDHFKRFNDTFGHQTGDEVLRSLGRFLTQHLRPTDVVCRYGGEEFTILLPDTNVEQSALRMNQLREQLDSLATNLPQPVTLSFGVAGFPEHGDSGDALIRIADGALYASKQGGRDQVSIAPFSTLRA